MSNQDDGEIIREQGLLVGERDDAFAVVASRAPDPLPRAIARGPDVVTARDEGVVSDEDLLHRVEIVGHAYRSKVPVVVEAGDFNAGEVEGGGSVEVDV